jgi:hypothetical protein
MDERLRAEIERLALSDARSGRAALAKIEALRLLEKLDRQGDVEIPVDDDGRFHPGPPEMFELDRHDPDEVREGWRESRSRRASRGLSS